MSGSQPSSASASSSSSSSFDSSTTSDEMAQLVALFKGQSLADSSSSFSSSDKKTPEDDYEKKLSSSSDARSSSASSSASSVEEQATAAELDLHSDFLCANEKLHKSKLSALGDCVAAANLKMESLSHLFNAQIYEEEEIVRALVAEKGLTGKKRSRTWGKTFIQFLALKTVSATQSRTWSQVLDVIGEMCPALEKFGEKESDARRKATLRFCSWNLPLDLLEPCSKNIQELVSRLVEVDDEEMLYDSLDYMLDDMLAYGDVFDCVFLKPFSHARAFPELQRVVGGVVASLLRTIRGGVEAALGTVAEELKELLGEREIKAYLWQHNKALTSFPCTELVIPRILLWAASAAIKLLPLDKEDAKTVFENATFLKGAKAMAAMDSDALDKAVVTTKDHVILSVVPVQYLYAARSADFRSLHGTFKLRFMRGFVLTAHKTIIDSLESGSAPELPETTKSTIYVHLGARNWKDHRYDRRDAVVKSLLELSYLGTDVKELDDKVEVADVLKCPFALYFFYPGEGDWTEKGGDDGAMVKDMKKAVDRWPGVRFFFLFMNKQVTFGSELTTRFVEFRGAQVRVLGLSYSEKDSQFVRGNEVYDAFASLLSRAFLFGLFTPVIADLTTAERFTGFKTEATLAARIRLLVAPRIPHKK